MQQALAPHTAPAATDYQTRRRQALLGVACTAWPWPTRVLAQQAQAQALNAALQLHPPQRKAWPRRVATPALQLPLLDGQPWSLAAHKDQAVLLNFWASWCEPCRAEMPALEQLAARHPGLQLLPVNFKETESTVRRFMEATGLKLPVLRDADGAVARAFGVTIFPSSVAINRQGRAAFSIVGECDWGSAAVNRWLAEL